MNEYTYYELYKHLGKCPKCLKVKKQDGYVYCEECRKNRVENDKKYYKNLKNDEEKYKKYIENNNRRQKIYYQRKKESGFCVRCGKKNDTKCACCQECRDKMKAYAERKKSSANNINNIQEGRN